MLTRPRPAPLLGNIVAGRYRAVQLLGSGGLGDVYLGEPIAGEGSRERVAVKVLRDEHRAHPDRVRRFLREAEAAGSVRHPNVLRMLEGPVDCDGVWSYVTELLVGMDLADTLTHAGALAPVRAVKIACGAALGLAATHAAGIVHRDVKPENIFLVHAPDGREVVRLLDFGAAFLAGEETVSRCAVGTPEYMAPEQARGAAARPCADVYALGVVLYEMLAGRVPFAGSAQVLARLHASAPLPPIASYNRCTGISEALADVVARTLAKSPLARLGSMHELREALLATPEGIEASSR